MNNIEFIDASIRAKDTMELTRDFSAFLAGFGLDRYMGAVLSRSETTQREKDLGFVVNYPPEWFQHYLTKHYVDYDPVYQNALRSWEPFTWEQVIKNKPGPLGKKVMDEAREFGLIGGIGVCVLQPNGKRIGLGISSSMPGARMDKAALTRIHAATFSFFTAYFYLRGESSRTPIPLSPREREILTWIACGKTKPETADILCISESCIKRHCENVSIKLGTASLAHAVAKAMHLGMIQPF